MGTPALTAKWMLKQVQHDEMGFGASGSNLRRRLNHPCIIAAAACLAWAVRSGITLAMRF